MVRRNIFILSAALLLGACVTTEQMPTQDASRVDRIVLAERSTFGPRCRAEAPAFNQSLTPWDMTERCACFDRYVIENLDGRIAAWAVQYRDWVDRPIPEWVHRRQDMRALAVAGFKACDLNPVN